MITRNNINELINMLPAEEIKKGLYDYEYIVIKASFFNAGVIVDYELVNDAPEQDDEGLEVTLQLSEVLEQIKESKNDNN